MRNIFKLFASDMKRLKTNVVTIVTVIGLVVLPSIFSWYNIIACWDVFDNTGNLTVAVANCDEGYTSDVMPIKINIGEQVTSALRKNDQLNWIFTSEEDAIDGTRAGRYYAAVVIPPSFSSDMMSFYSPDVEHARITYYSNEKKNAVAPKVTDQGADQVARQINRVFTETISEIALALSSALASYADDADLNGAVGNIGEHLNRVGGKMGEAAEAIRLYAEVLGSSGSIVEDAGTLLASAQNSARDISASAQDARNAAETVPQTLSQTTAALSQTVEACKNDLSSLPEAIDAAFDSTGTLAIDAAKQLRYQADDIDALAADYRAMASEVQTLAGYLADTFADSAYSLARRIEAQAAQQEQLRDALIAAADDIDAADVEAQQDRADAQMLAGNVQSDLNAARADYDDALLPALDDLATTLQTAGSSLADAGVALDDAATDLVGRSSSLSQQLNDAQGQLSSAADKLEASGQRISGLGDEIAQALAAKDGDALASILGSNPQALAQAIAAPIAVERHAVFPVENFGSAMSPLYTTLALWIGALLIMVTLKLAPSQKTLDELGNPSAAQVFIGRFGVVACISLLQSTTVALGNLLFLGVQAVRPELYLLCFWVAGLTFAFIIYTLVALFANFGKALSVIALIVQVSGGGGSFPLLLLPEFFQNISPYLPVAHAINAMRAAMFGLYANDFWIELGKLALFVIPLFVMGTVLNGPLGKIVPKFVARVERSKLM